MSAFKNKLSLFIKKYVFAEDENLAEKKRGQLYLETPKSRVKFESELINEDDFDRAIQLLTHEKHILFEREINNF